MSGIGGDIKVTLTLDDNGFSAKTEKASQFVKALNAALKDSSAFSEQFEKSIGGLSKDMQDFGARFGNLEASLAKFAASITGAVDKLGAIADKAKGVKQSVNDLSSSFSPVGKNAAALSKSIDGIGVSMAQLKPSIAQAISSINQLGDAQKKGAATAKQAAKDAEAAKIAELEAEIATNKRIIAERSRTYDELNRLATELENRALGARVKADEELAIAQRIIAQGEKAALTSGKQSYVKGAQTSAAPYISDASVQQAEANRLEQNATAARLEALAIGELIQTINRENGERAARISAIERDAEALKSLTAATNEAAAAEQRFASLPIMQTLQEASAELDKAAEAMHLAAVASLEAGDDFVKQQIAAMGAAKAAEELAAAEARAAETARVAAEQAHQRKQDLEDQNAAMRAQADMLKSLGAAWAAFKIEEAFQKAVSTESQIQQQELQVKALNLGPQQQAEFFGKALELSKASPYLSYLDAVKTRLSAISSIGDNDAELIDKTIGKVTQVAQNLQLMGLAHGDLQSSVRNIYGVAEARGQINDAEKTNQTADLVGRIIEATAGKVNQADLETLLRRDQPFAQQMTDDGLIHLAALIDMSKTAGGEGGGGAGSGASTIGVIARAFATYANGGRLNNQAIKQLTDAGILNTDGIDFSKGKVKALGELRFAGMKNAALASADPVAYMQQMLPSIMAAMNRDPDKYFAKGADRNNEQVIQDALEKFFNRLGFRNTATQAMAFATNPEMVKRINRQSEQIKQEKSSEQVASDAYGMLPAQWEQTKKNLTDLAGTVGKDLAPAVSGVLTELNKLLAAMNSFAENHSFLTQIAAASTAFLGVKLAIQGVTGVFGSLGTLASLLTGFGGGAKAAGEAAEVAASKTGLLSGAFRLFEFPLLTKLGGLLMDFAEKFAPAFVRGGGLVVDALMLFGETVGKVLLRAIPFVGELMIAWDLAKLVGSLEVGGHTVSDWFTHWFDSLELKAQKFWQDMKGWFSDIANWKFNPSSWFDGKDENGQTHFVSRQDTNAHGTTTGGPNPRAAADAARVAAADKARQQREWAFNTPAGTGAPMGFGSAAPAQQPDQQQQKPTVYQPDPRAQQVVDGEGGGRKKHPFEDPYQKSLAQLQATRVNDVYDIGSLLTRTAGPDQLLVEAMNDFKAKWAGGDFDIGHDPTKRRWKNADGTLNEQAPEVQQWVQAKAAVEQYAEQKKALTFANERLAAAETTANEALERLTSGNLTKQTAAFTALEKELARAQERLQAGTKAFQDWQMQKDAALFEQARTDLSTYNADLRAKDKQTEDEDAANAPNSKRARTEQKYRNLVAQQSKEEEARLSELDLTYAQSAFDISNNSDLTEEAKQARLAQIEQEYYQTRQKNAEAFAEHMKSVWQQYQKDMETPLDQMVKQWKDTDDEIDQQEVSWSNEFMNTFMNFVKTGKFQWQSFVESIGMDVLKDEMQKALGDPLKSIFGNLGNLVRNYVTGDSTKPQFTLPDMPGGGVTQGASTLTGANGLPINTAIQQATTGLTQFGSQIGKSVFSLGDQAAKTATEATASAAASTGLQSVATAASQAAAALASVGGGSGGGSGGLGGLFGGLFGGGSSGSGGGAGAWGVGDNSYGFTMPDAAFANGGIMTEFGEVELRKYANGGVANSPQLALFGEGSMAEAYVPLPDGRSIPVTVQGGQSGAPAPNVSVNVINQTGQPVNAQQSNVRWDGRQAILDVVMSAANQPGPFRDNLRGAMN